MVGARLTRHPAVWQAVRRDPGATRFPAAPKRWVRGKDAAPTTPKRRARRASGLRPGR